MAHAQNVFFLAQKLESDCLLGEISSPRNIFGDGVGYIPFFHFAFLGGGRGAVSFFHSPPQFPFLFPLPPIYFLHPHFFLPRPCFRAQVLLFFFFPFCSPSLLFSLFPQTHNKTKLTLSTPIPIPSRFPSPFLSLPPPPLFVLFSPLCSFHSAPLRPKILVPTLFPSVIGEHPAFAKKNPKRKDWGFFRTRAKKQKKG